MKFQRDKASELPHGLALNRFAISDCLIYKAKVIYSLATTSQEK